MWRRRSRLYEINLTTGAATLLGPSRARRKASRSHWLLRADGVIFMHVVETDAWYSVNRTTLVATQLGPFGSDTNFGQGASLRAMGSVSRFVDDHGRQSEPTGHDQPDDGCTDVCRGSRIDTVTARRHRFPVCCRTNSNAYGNCNGNSFGNADGDTVCWNTADL